MQPNPNTQQLSDRFIAVDCLETCKHAADTLVISALESTRPGLRQVFAQAVEENIQMADEMFRFMRQKGWYNVTWADDRQISQMQNEYRFSQAQGRQQRQQGSQQQGQRQSPRQQTQHQSPQQGTRPQAQQQSSQQQARAARSQPVKQSNRRQQNEQPSGERRGWRG